MKSETKNCQNCKKDFVVEPEDFNFYEKIQVPPPTFCPHCRFIRRMIWRNERSLYKRTCDLCNENIISIYDTSVAFPVYCPECWRSDNWDSSKYAQEYDFNKPFFAQWKELFNKVPRPSLFQTGKCLNSSYSNYITDIKNVYLGYSILLDSDGVYYSSNVDNSKEIIDSYNVSESEFLYENLGSTKNYNCQYGYFSSSCIDCNFILDCSNCQNCFGCVNLRNKNYCIWNKQYSKEEYLSKMANFNLGSHQFVQKTFGEFFDFSLRLPRKYARIINCVNSNGDDLRDCKNIDNVFKAFDCEDIKYGYRISFARDSMDVCHSYAEMAYEHATGGSEGSQKIKFIISGVSALNEVEYSDFCASSSNLFGCIALKNKKYCILNKQHTKEEYEKQLPQIKIHMDEMPYVDIGKKIYKYGEFFPCEFSPFGYNETIVNDHFPCSKKEVVGQGYKWKEKTENKYIITKKADELPDDIKDVNNSILNETIECAVTKKPFKITPFELQFYRRMNIPIPRIHQDERYRERLLLKNQMRLWHRQCMCEKENHFHGTGKCEIEFETSYAPDRLEIVYCEKCYQQEVY